MFKTPVHELERTRDMLTGDFVKLCKDCKHYKRGGLLLRGGSFDKCTRRLQQAVNPITGKTEILGEIKFCETEREITSELPTLVEQKLSCGAIGQFWKYKEKSKLNWFSRLFKRKK